MWSGDCAKEVFGQSGGINKERFTRKGDKMVKKINEKEFKELEKKGTMVVDFNATWCGPCKMLGPVLEEVSEEVQDVQFFAIDTDENPNLAREYKIMSIPAVALIKDGELADMHVGFAPKDEIKKFVTQ